MPDDFDPVAWFEGQKKSTPVAAKPAADFDPVKWFEGQQKPQRPPSDQQMTFNLNEPRPAAPNVALPSQRQAFIDRPLSLDESLRQSAQFNRGAAVAPRPKIVDRPVDQSLSGRAYDAVARGGGALAKTARNTIAAIGGGRVPGGQYALQKIDEFRAERDAELAANQQARGSGGFLTDIGESILEAAPVVAAGGLLAGAGIPAPLVGGGLSAAGADWNDPRRAVAQTLIGAAAPVLGGRLGQGIGSAVAGRLAAPVARTAARFGGEVLGGGAGNVIGTGAEQLAFGNGLDPKQLLQSGLVGAALNVPGAITSARRVPNTIREVRLGPLNARQTQPLPELQGPGRVTSPLPENAPTAGLPDALQMAMGRDAFDHRDVKVSDLGLPFVERPPNQSGTPRSAMVRVSDIVLGRDSLNKGRIFQAAEALEKGFKSADETYTTPGGSVRKVDPVSLVPHPTEPGKWIVSGDGNHRVGLLQLQGYQGEIPAEVYGTPLPRVRPESEGGPPEIYAEPFSWENFQVKDATNQARNPSQWTNGPRIRDAVELSLGNRQIAPQQPPPNAPPELGGKLFDRTPRQQGLFKGAPADQGPGLFRKLTELRRAGLLTNPATHGRNVGATWLNLGLEEAARIPSSIADLAISSFTGRRTVAGPSPRGLAQSFREAAGRGLSEAKQVLSRGATREELQQLQIDSDVTFQNPIARAYSQIVFRSLGAADKVANAFAYRRSLEERALSQAKTEARQNKNINVRQRAQELAANPSSEMALGAVEDALVSTFNNENLPNLALSAAKQKIAPKRGGKAAGFALDLVAPFTRTPSNVVARVIEYSGGGTIKGGVGIAKAIIQGSMTPAQQRAISQSLGRGATGAGGLVTLGYILASKGYLTGFGEDDEGRRNRDIAVGRQAGSIYDPISKKWRRISGFAPVSTMLLIGASLYNESAREDEGDALKRYSKIGAQVVGDSPLVIGSKDVATSLTRPGTLAEKAGSFVGSFVPSALSGAGSAMDTKEREGKGFVGRIQSRLPYLRESLPEQTDVLGRGVQRRGFDFLNPAPGSTPKTGDFERELVRLDIGLNSPSRLPGETDGNYRDRKKLAGGWVETYGNQLVNDPGYQRATKEQQRAVWRKLQTAAHSESDEAYPNLEKLNPVSLMESVISNEERKREKEAEKKFSRR